LDVHSTHITSNICADPIELSNIHTLEPASGNHNPAVLIASWTATPEQIKAHNQPHYSHSRARPNQKFIRGVLLPSLPSLSFLPSPLLLSVPPSATPQTKGLRSTVSSPSGEERHLQPPDTFPGL